MSTLACEAMLTNSTSSTDPWHAQGYAGHVDLVEETALLQPLTILLKLERPTCLPHAQVNDAGLVLSLR